MNRMKLLHKIIKSALDRRYENEIQRLAKLDSMMQGLNEELFNRHTKMLNAIKTIRERRRKI